MKNTLRAWVLDIATGMFLALLTIGIIYAASPNKTNLASTTSKHTISLVKPVTSFLDKVFD